MLITDFSEQHFHTSETINKISLPELLTAGMIFILPIIFLLIISAS